MCVTCKFCVTTPVLSGGIGSQGGGSTFWEIWERFRARFSGYIRLTMGANWPFFLFFLYSPTGEGEGGRVGHSKIGFSKDLNSHSARSYYFPRSL